MAGSSTVAFDDVFNRTGDTRDMFGDEDDAASRLANPGDAGGTTSNAGEDDAPYPSTPPIPGALTGDQERAPMPRGAGPLLEQPSDAKVFKAIEREVDRQERLAKNREQGGKHWERVKKGVPHAVLHKAEDTDVWEAILPPGIQDVEQPIPNKVLSLCEKQVSQILVDPPVPNPKPDGDSDEAQGAMDLAGRFLRSNGGVNGTNESEIWRWALSTNRTRQSAFVYFWVDPTGGGWRPKQKYAHPFAPDPSKPLMGPMFDDNGAPVMDQHGAPQMERAIDPVLRYVAEQPNPENPDGPPMQIFTDSPAAAAREWMPKIMRMLLLPSQVRTHPQTATVATASKITLLLWEPLGDAKKRFACLNEMSDSELKALTTWKPKRWKSLVPRAQRPKGEALDASGEVTDDTLLFWYHHLCRIGPTYQDGAELSVSGATMGGVKGFVLKRDTLREDVDLDDGKQVPVLMDPPVAQFRAVLDTTHGDPFGGFPIEAFGGANQTRAHLYLGVLEDLDLRLHINTFIPSESNVTRDKINKRDGTPIPVLTKDHMPTFEQRPALPGTITETLDRVEHDMDVGANLSQTAQALDSAYSESGEAKKVSLSQAKVQLAQEWQGFIDGVLQCWRIQTQLAQARYKQPMLVRAAGQNAGYKARYFVGADLIGVSDVALMPGSATMMSAAEKAQYLAQGQAQKWLDPQRAGEMFRASMSDDLGLTPSVHEERIDREIAEFLEGPPKGWLDQFKARQQAMAQQAAHPPQPGQPAPPPPPPLYTPFEPRVNDEEPVVAQVRYEKLSKLVSGGEFGDLPKPWQATANDEYTRMAYAAGVTTVRQQQAAQQQASNAQAQAQGAPPSWQTFTKAITDKVVTIAEQAIAKDISGLENAGGGGQPEQPAGAAAAGGAPGPVIVSPHPKPLPTHAVDLRHQTMEASRDRAHEKDMAALKHANAMELQHAKTHAASVQSIGTELARATREAARQQNQPAPAAPTAAPGLSAAAPVQPTP